MPIRMDILFVDRKLTSLSKSFRTSTDTTHEGFLTSVSILMLLQVLRQRESLLAMTTYMLLLGNVTQIVALKRKLAGEELLAVPNIALV